MLHRQNKRWPEALTKRRQRPPPRNFSAAPTDGNIFSMQELSSGYLVAGAHEQEKDGEGKCGDGKCGDDKEGEDS